MSLDPIERYLRLLLISQARLRRPITYKTLSVALAPRSPVKLQPPYSPLYGWLGNVSSFEFRAGRPLLSALVIGQDLERPGKGFFKFAQGLGLVVENEDAFWQGQLHALFAAWPSTESTLITTHTISLSDGRHVRVREYAGGAIRLLVDDPPYDMNEAYLARGKTETAILRLAPRAYVEPTSESAYGPFEVLSQQRLRILEWNAMLHGVSKAMTEEERAELLEWERSHLDGHSVGTHDWPGWRKYIGAPPWEPAGEDSSELRGD